MMDMMMNEQQEMWVKQSQQQNRAQVPLERDAQQQQSREVQLPSSALQQQPPQQQQVGEDESTTVAWPSNNGGSGGTTIPVSSATSTTAAATVNPLSSSAPGAGVSGAVGSKRTRKNTTMESGGPPLADMLLVAAKSGRGSVELAGGSGGGDSFASNLLVGDSSGVAGLAASAATGEGEKVGSGEAGSGISDSLGGGGNNGAIDVDGTGDAATAGRGGDVDDASNCAGLDGRTEKAGEACGNDESDLFFVDPFKIMTSGKTGNGCGWVSV